MSLHTVWIGESLQSARDKVNTESGSEQNASYAVDAAVYAAEEYSKEKWGEEYKDYPENLYAIVFATISLPHGGWLEFEIAGQPRWSWCGYRIDPYK